MALQKTMKERLADQAKRRAEMKVKRAASKKAKSERKSARDVKTKAKQKKLDTAQAARKKKQQAQPVSKPYKIKGMGGPQKSVAEKKKVKAKKAADKSWKEATGKQKKEGKKGVTLSSLIAKRKGLTKGTSAYASIQNQINKAYGVKKRHTATTKTKPKPKPKLKAKPDVRKIVKNLRKAKKATPKVSKPTPKVSKPTPSGPESPIGKKEYEGTSGQIPTLQRNRPKDVGGKEAWKAPADKYRIKKQEGGLIGKALELAGAENRGLGDSQSVLSSLVGGDALPTSDAVGRSETYLLGGMVKPPTAPSMTPPPSYKKGGKVKK